MAIHAFYQKGSAFFGFESMKGIPASRDEKAVGFLTTNSVLLKNIGS
jgi:hypothetical protein